MGCGTNMWFHENTPQKPFQYPLRAYGLWNPGAAGQQHRERYFQYPLRAYGLWNIETADIPVRSIWLSVPSAGLWAVEQPSEKLSRWNGSSFSTLCGPMGCGTRQLAEFYRAHGRFQYPLRAYGLWNLRAA